MVAKPGEKPAWLLDDLDITDEIEDWAITKAGDGSAKVVLTLRAELDVLLAGNAVDVLVKVDD